MFLNYPNNPTGAIVPDGLFERVVELAREHEILVVHDNAYSETTYDGYVAPSFLATPGAKEVGVEVFSLSKGFNMTGWRCAAILGNADAIADLLAAEDERRLGPVRGGPARRRGRARTGPREPLEEMNEIYPRRRDLVVAALREIGVDVEPPKGTIYVWAPVPEGHTSTSFAELGARGGGGGDLARLDVRAQRRGLLPDLADHARRAHRRGRRADARAPRVADPAPEMETRRHVRSAVYEVRFGFSRAVRVGDRVLVAGSAPIWPMAQFASRPPRPGAALLRDHRRRAGGARGRSRRRRADLDVHHRSRERRRRRRATLAASSARSEPASTMVVVAALLDPRWLVEVEAEAQVG